MEDDLLVTNKYISSRSSRKNIDKEDLEKFLKARRKYPNTYTDKPIDELNLPRGIQNESFLVRPRRVGLSSSGQTTVSGDTVEKYKKTVITIDSRNRLKNTKVTSEIIPNTNNRIYNWTFRTSYRSRFIEVYAPGHGLQPTDENSIDVFFTNLNDNDNYDSIGLSKNSIEYNPITNRPKFNVVSVDITNDAYFDEVQGLWVSNFFTIEIPNGVLDIRNIKEALFGGPNVSIFKEISYEQGYQNTSHYRIQLGKIFNNVKMVKLVSIEIPNTSYTINSNQEVSEIDSEIKSKVNSSIKWINSENSFNTYNLSLYSDKIFLNTIDLNKLSENTSLLKNTNNNIQMNNNNTESIKNNVDLINNYSIISSNSESFDSEVRLGDFSNFDFYSPKIFHTNSDSYNTSGILNSSDFISNNGIYLLSNVYHNIGKTLIYDIKNSLNQYSDTEKTFLFHNNIKNYDNFIYEYINNLVSKNKYIDIDFSDNTTFKNFLLELDSNNNLTTDNIGIPKYLGYFTFNNNFTNGVNKNLLCDEFVETFVKDSEYIYPITDSNSEKLLAPILIPNSQEINSGIQLINQTRYPIYEVNLEEGKYTKNKFISALQNTLTNVDNKVISFKEKYFKKINLLNYKNNYQNNTNSTKFKVNVNNNINLIDIRQYSELKKINYKKNDDKYIFFYNEAIPYINLKIKGHSFKTGDKILLENCPSFDNIDSSELNKEHFVYVMPSYKIYLRLIYPLPDKTYLDSNKYFENQIENQIKISDMKKFQKIIRDVSKLTVSKGSINENNTELFMYNNNTNSDDICGSNDNSQKENYPLKVYNSSERIYGDFEKNSQFPFGIYKNESESYFLPNSTSNVNLDEETLLSSGNIDKLKKINKSSLKTNINYSGAKMINEVNNGSLIPEKFSLYNKNEIKTQGPSISLLKNEIFVKLDDLNNINTESTIGRITTIYNNSKPDKNGNYSIKYNLINDSKISNFKIGDYIFGLNSNCIAMIVPESWNYKGTPSEDVISKGMGTYILEKYRNHKILKKLTNDVVENKFKFANKFNSWENKIEMDYENIYIKINTIPNNTSLNGIPTDNLEIYKPIKFRFIFDENTSPIDKLNIPIDQEFAYSQNNCVDYDSINILNSYLIRNNNISSASNNLIIETLENPHFSKNQRIYIKNHKLFNKYTNNRIKKTLSIKNIEPFRNYFKYLENLLDEKKNYANNLFNDNGQDISFKNINHIINYENNNYEFNIGKNNNLLNSFGYLNQTQFDYYPFQKFHGTENNFSLGLRDRFINWFFENKFIWNGNNLEKVLDFENNFTNDIENKKLIIKFIVSPLDTKGNNFLRIPSINNNDSESDNFHFIREPPYTNIYNESFKRNSENTLQFLPGMGVYHYSNNKPEFIGYVLDTSLENTKEYIDDYSINEYQNNRGVSAIQIINSSSNFNACNPPTIVVYNENGISNSKLKPIINNGTVTEIIVCDSGFNYTNDSFIDNTNDKLEIILQSGQTLEIKVYFQDIAPTYSLFILVDKDSVLFKNNDGSIDQDNINESKVAELNRGLDIYYNFNRPIIDYFEFDDDNPSLLKLSTESSSNINNYYQNWSIEIIQGLGKGKQGIIQSYDNLSKIIILEDSVSFDIDINTQYRLIPNISNRDNKNYKCYNNLERRACATIYQGSLQNIESGIFHLVSGHLEYFYYKYLQNKCIVRYKQNLSKEELEYFYNHQIILSKKELFINENKNYNNYNYTENNYNTSDMEILKLKSFVNRKFLPNQDTISYHSFDIGDNIYIYDHENEINVYNEFTVPNAINAGELLNDNTITQKNLKTEYSGISCNNYDVLCNLWNGFSNDANIDSIYKPGKCVLIDKDFDEFTEKGLNNKGYIQTNGYTLSICGDNAEYYNKDIEYDIITENQAVVINNDDYPMANKRGNNQILLHNSYDTTSNILNLFEVNDIVVISTNIIGKDTEYITNKNSRNIVNNTELNVITNLQLSSDGNFIVVDLKKNLLNDHNDDEIVIARYKYGEIYNDGQTYTIDSDNNYQIKLKRNIDSIDYSDKIDVGTILCFDWANKMYSNKNQNIPKDIITDVEYNLLTSENSIEYEKVFTQQINRVIAINLFTNYIVVTLENKPYFNYLDSTPFIILKKNNPKYLTPNDNDSQYINHYCSDKQYQNSIKYSNIATQPFTINQKWYTKIFYKGHESLNPNFNMYTTNSDQSISVDKNYINNNIKNDWQQGTMAYNKFTSKKVYIGNMKGIKIPFMPIASSNDSLNQELNLHYSNVSSYQENIPYDLINNITPVPNDIYLIKPIINEDHTNLIEKNNNKLSIPGKFINNFEYINTNLSESINKYINCSNIKYWDDNIQSSSECGNSTIDYNKDNSYEYNFIVIEGIYLGYGGKIIESYDDDDNIINSVDGHNVIQTYRSSLGYKTIIDISENVLNLDANYNIKSSEYNSNINILPTGILSSSDYFEFINKDIFNNTIMIGNGGEIFKKKINAPLDLQGDSYIYLCIPNLEHIHNTSTPLIDNVFAKILIPGESRKILYNTHIGGFKIFYDGLLNNLDELELTFLTNENTLFNFNGQDHSLTFEIYEVI